MIPCLTKLCIYTTLNKKPGQLEYEIKEFNKLKLMTFGVIKKKVEQKYLKNKQ